MQRYYIYQKRKELLRIEDIAVYPYYKDVINELPWECLGYVDGVENLYETFRQMVLPYHLETLVFADSFSYSLGERLRAAYLIVDGKGKIRDFWELTEPIRKKRRRNYQIPYQYRNSAVPGVHKKRKRAGYRHPATTAEKRMMVSTQERRTLHEEYPDASIHVGRDKRNSLPDVYDDLFRSDWDSRSWKDCKGRTRQWDKGRKNSGTYVTTTNMLSAMQEFSEFEDLIISKE